MIGDVGINGKQVLVIAATALVLAVMLIYPPWKTELGFHSENTPGGMQQMEAESVRRYGPIWRPPRPTPEEEKEWGPSKPAIDFKVLLVQAIPAIAIGLLFHQSFKSRVI